MDRFQALIEASPLGYVVAAAELDRLLYVSPAARALWETASTLEGRPLAGIEADFLKACQIERTRTTWIVRVLGAHGKDTLALRVYMGEELAWEREPGRVYTLVPQPAEEPADGPFIFGKLRLDLDHGTLMYGRAYVELTTVEFRLLGLLVANGDRLQTKEKLLREGWGRRATTTRTLDVTVSRLRRKLESFGCPAETIRTVHGRGYRFMPSVLVG